MESQSQTRLSNFHFQFTSARLPSLWTPSPPYSVSDLEPLPSFSGPTLMCEADHLLWPTCRFRTGRDGRQRKERGRKGQKREKKSHGKLLIPTDTDQCV